MTDGEPEADGGSDAPSSPPLRDDVLDAVEVRDALSNVSVVIASNRPRCRTVETAPDWLDAVVRTDRGRNVARNRAVEEAENDWIVVADDDISFPTTLTAMLVDSMHRRHVIGLEDVWPMEWTLTRYTIFHRSVWEAIGGFDESREHGGDTDFCIRAEKAGVKVYRLPRHLVPHHDRDSEFDLLTHAEWLFYLTRRHPLAVLPKALLLVLAKANLVSRPDDDYPPGWRGSIWDLSDPPEEVEAR